MTIKTVEHPLINRWANACGLDLGKIASAAAHACGSKVFVVAYQPTWPQETASTQENTGMTIYMEQPLFLDPKANKDILFKRNFYLHGHEFSHPLEERFSVGKWFRYDVCMKPYVLDMSTPEGFEHANEMSEKDTVIDSKLADKDKMFAEGFLETHIISAIIDSQKLGGRRLKRGSNGKLRFYKNTSLEEIITLELSINRRNAIVEKIMQTHDLTPRHQEFAKYMKQQNVMLQSMLRYPDLQEVHNAIRTHYKRTAMKQKDRNEILMDLMQRIKDGLVNN